MVKDPDKVLKKFIKTDEELIHDIIEMELFDTGEPIYIREELKDDEFNINQN